MGDRPSELDQDTVIVVDLVRFGTWVQYRPDDTDQFPVSVSVRELTDDEVTEYAKQEPAEEPKDEPETNGEQSRQRQARLHVRVEICERFALEGMDLTAGRCIHFVAQQTSSADEVSA